ncbi:MAG: LamG domain-containing protein [Burkholderiaceae bacterium]|nr:LamG domain-containing protein [Burkholderiaceae bacterium]
MSGPQQLFLTGATSAPTDPYWSDVKLLLHLNGSNGSTTFTDSSASAHTVAANNGAQLTTSDFAFGGASATFDGVNDVAQTVPASADFDLFAGDFTLEWWAKYAGTAFNGGMVELNYNATNRGNVSVVFGNVDFYSEQAGSGSTKISAAAPSTGAWHHFALTKSGTTFELWFDGASAGTSTTTQYPSGSNMTAFVGASGVGNFYAGLIDDVRITKGTARYTGAFTPPSSQFPDS